MKNYVVTWTIDIEADSAEDAAKAALEIHRDPTSIATCFEVKDTETGFVDFIDLPYGDPE